MSTPFPLWLKCLLFGLLCTGAVMALDALLGRQVSPVKGLLIGMPFGLVQYWGLMARARKAQQTNQKDNT